MAERGSLYQPSDDESRLGIGPSFYSAPLLPFERELISTINITEDEYRYFVAEAIRRSKIRPAAYDHIPDIQNGPVTPFVVSVAASLLVTGVTLLLTPKPRMPKARRQEEQRLSTLTEGRRFIPSRGFDTLAELADYNSPIPIVFGLYNNNIGGMLVTPKMVWSRMYSLGTEQAALLMFVVGEEGSSDGRGVDGLELPALSGIFLGNNALDAIYSNLFAFYWKRNTTTSGSERIKQVNLEYGTCAIPTRGALGDDDDVYLCPTDSANDTGFSHSFSPANNNTFGCYAPISNGTNYRLNFMPVSIPENTPEQSQVNSIIRRIKIAGDGDRGKLFGNTNFDDDNYLFKARDLFMGNGPTGRLPNDLESKRRQVKENGQELNGRNYACRMGISSHNSVVFPSGDETGLSKVQSVKVNDVIEFIISDSVIPKDFYKRGDNRGEEVDEINNGVKTLCREADEAMQIGQIFAIGSTIWQVTERERRKFDLNDDQDGEDQVVKMVCIDTSESLQKKIGLVDRQKVVHPGTYVSDGNGIGEIFFPITRYAKAVVRNNRPADVTEFGIKSRVFQRLNGIGNFMSFPLPNRLQDLDQDNIQLQGGTITRNIPRTSCFIVFVRKAGLQSNGKEYTYDRVGPLFAVTGSSPIDQYHFIRFKHPPSNGPTEFEYKFVPVPGAELRGLTDSNTQIVQLTAAATQQNQLVTIQATTKLYGVFTITTAGDETVSIKTLKVNTEFTTGGQTSGGRISSSDTPTLVVTDAYLPDGDSLDEERATNFELYPSSGGGWRVATPGWPGEGKDGSFTWDVMTTMFPGRDGKADGRPEKYPEDAVVVKQKEYFSVPGVPNAVRWLLVEYTFLKKEMEDDYFTNFAPQNKTKKIWVFKWDDNTPREIGRKILKASGSFRRGEVLEIRRGLNGTNGPKRNSGPYPNSNPFTIKDGKKLTYSGYKVKITNTQKFSGPDGRRQAYFFEVFGKANDKKIGQKVSTVREIGLGGGKRIFLKISSEVISLGDNDWSDEVHGYKDVTIEVDKRTTGKYALNETIDDAVTLSINNPFKRASNRKCGIRYRIAKLSSSKSPTVQGSQRNFANETQTSDISMYRDYVEKSNQHEPEHEIVYVNELTRNTTTPTYTKMTTAGLLIKASRNFTKLDQLRTWLPKGIHVKRLHPQPNTYENSNRNSPTYGQRHGPSNLLTDLIYFLLTDDVTGAGKLLQMTPSNPVLIDEPAFKNTSKFLRRNNLYFNGAITERSNMRDLISELAPNFLCNFIINDGKFSLVPAFPVDGSGSINQNTAIKIKHIFTEGNIIENSFQLEYLDAEERAPFQASVRYREERPNKFPQERVIDVIPTAQRNLPIETFDLTAYCTSRHHAEMVARYFITIRNLVTHTVKFSTTVNGLDLKAGDFIKVMTESNPYHPANLGTVDANGVVTSTTPLDDGTYKVLYYIGDEYQVADMKVSKNKVTNPTFRGIVFTILADTNSEIIYMIEQLTFSQDGTVDIVGSEYPCDKDKKSLLAKNVLDDTLYDVVP